MNAIQVNDYHVLSAAPPVRITPREQEVLNLVSHGFTDHEIGDRLYISHHTVKSHRKNLLEKLKSKNTANLIRIGMIRGYITY